MLITSLPGAPVALAMQGAALAAVWHAAAPDAAGGQILDCAVCDLAVRAKVAGGRMPLSAGAGLAWLGFGEDGELLAYDTQARAGARTSPGVRSWRESTRRARAACRACCACRRATWAARGCRCSAPTPTAGPARSTGRWACWEASWRASSAALLRSTPGCAGPGACAAPRCRCRDGAPAAGDPAARPEPAAAARAGAARRRRRRGGPGGCHAAHDRAGLSPARARGAHPHRLHQQALRFAGPARPMPMLRPAAQGALGERGDSEARLAEEQAAADRALLRLYQAALKAERLGRALDLAACLALPRSLEGALRLARHHRWCHAARQRAPQRGFGSGQAESACARPGHRPWSSACRSCSSSCGRPRRMR